MSQIMKILEITKDIEHAFTFIDHYFLTSPQTKELNKTVLFNCDIKSSIEHSNENWISLYAEDIVSFHANDYCKIKQLFNKYAKLTRLDNIYIHINTNNELEAILRIVILE